MMPRTHLFFLARFGTILLGAIFLMQGCSAEAVSLWDMEPGEVREKINSRIFSIEAETPVVGKVTDKEVSLVGRKTPIRIYTPSVEADLPVVLLIHGGAWVAGNLDTHDHLARFLCTRVGCIVVSVDYLNAPEGKFPLQLEQCRDALNWIVEHVEELSVDSSQIAVVGDSAGGNLAAALCLMLRDRSERKIALQVLINPALNLTCNGTLIRQNDALDPLRWQAFHYLADPNLANHPYVSPLMAKDHSGLPPAVVVVAENDDLREGGERYVERLTASGVPASLYCQLGIGHLAGDGARASPRALESLNVVVNALKNAF